MRPKSEKCLICTTTETPLWRMGPDMKRSLCNACGIRWRKTPEAEAIYQAIKEKKNMIRNASVDGSKAKSNRPRKTSSPKKVVAEPSPVSRPVTRTSTSSPKKFRGVKRSFEDSNAEMEAILDSVRRKIRKYDEFLAIKSLACLKYWGPADISDLIDDIGGALSEPKSIRSAPAQSQLQFQAPQQLSQQQLSQQQQQQQQQGCSDSSTSSTPTHAISFPSFEVRAF